MGELISNYVALDRNQVGNKKAFISSLTGDILKMTSHGREAWRFVTEKEIFDPNKIDLSFGSSSGSSTQSHSIDVGISSDMLSFEKESYLTLIGVQPTYTEIVTHRFLHEVMHGVDFGMLNSGSRDYEAVMSLFWTLRKAHGVGFTPVGSFSFYVGPERKFVEDFVDLAAYGTMSPNALRNWFSRLNNPGIVSDEFVKKNNLVRPSQIGISHYELMNLVLRVIPK